MDIATYSRVGNVLSEIDSLKRDVSRLTTLVERLTARYEADNPIPEEPIL